MTLPAQKGSRFQSELSAGIVDINKRLLVFWYSAENRRRMELVLEEKMATLPLGFPSGTVVLKDDIYNPCHDL